MIFAGLLRVKLRITTNAVSFVVRSVVFDASPTQSENPDQNAPVTAYQSRPTLFASIPTYRVYEVDDKAHTIFICTFLALWKVNRT